MSRNTTLVGNPAGWELREWRADKKNRIRHLPTMSAGRDTFLTLEAFVASRRPLELAGLPRWGTLRMGVTLEWARLVHFGFASSPSRNSRLSIPRGGLGRR